MSNSLPSHGHSPPDSSVHEILQARILEWVAIPSTRGWNPHLLHLVHWQEGSLLLEPSGKPLPILRPGSKKDTLPFFLSHYCLGIDHKSACNAGDLGLIPGLGRSLGEGKGYPLQYSGLESSMNCIVSPGGGKELDTTEQLSLSPMMNKDYFEHQGKSVIQMSLRGNYPLKLPIRTFLWN